MNIDTAPSSSLEKIPYRDVPFGMPYRSDGRLYIKFREMGTGRHGWVNLETGMGGWQPEETMDWDVTICPLAKVVVPCIDS